MRGWFEVTKLATGVAGSERLGRIYYKPDGQRVLVSVHIKQDEKQPVAKTKHHPAYGAMKGMITLLPGVDLTEPSYPDWKVLYGEDK